jgi:hypothetical protein
MSELPVVALLYRADWTRLSLSATTHHVQQADYDRRMADGRPPGWVRRPPWAEAVGPEGPGSRAAPPEDEAQRARPRETTGRLLIAPGGRYRIQDVDEDGISSVRGCDGDRPWLITGVRTDERAAGARMRMFGHPEPPFADLLCPSWLLNGFELVLRETAAVDGRAVHRVLASPRAAGPGARTGHGGWAFSIEAIVDAELGILLRCEQIAAGQVLLLNELREVRLDPAEAGDPAQFAAPPGSVVGEDTPPLFTGPGWQAAKTAAGVAAAGLGFAIKHAPRRPPHTPADDEAAMPQDDPAAEAGQPTDPQPVSDALINLLYRRGGEFPNITAEIHQWLDPRALLDPPGRAAGDATPGALAGRVPAPLAEALRERARTGHWAARIRLGAPDRYRIDYISGKGPRKPTTIACDGNRRWRVYENRVSVGPAAPLPWEIAQLIDPSWMLGWRLAGLGRVSFHGRPGIRIGAAHSPFRIGSPNAVMFSPAGAVADEELGILLRLTSYLGGRPAVRFELRDISGVSEPDPSDFRIGVPPGVRAVEDDGSIFGEADAPEAVRVAAQAAVEIGRRASAGISALGSFLDAVRGKNRPPTGS